MTLSSRLDKLRQSSVLHNAFSVLQQLLRKKGRNGRIVMAFVVIPTLCIAIYLTFLHSPMYVSHSEFALRSGDGVDISTAAIPLLGTAASSTTLDAFILQSYVGSLDMLQKVDQRVGLRAHFSDRSKDLYSRLWLEPTQEELLKYWQWIATANFNQEKGIISLEVKAYTPKMAKAINDAILEFSEELVNQINTRAHQDAVLLTQKEVAAAEERHLRAMEALQKFRDDKVILDPAATAQSLERIVTRLEDEAASIQAELTTTLSVMHKDSPKVATLQFRLRAVQEQIAKEKGRLAGLTSSDGVTSDPLSSLFGSYTHLASEEKFAQERLLKAMEAAEKARIQAIAQSRYIVAFQPPTLPEESMYPRPLLFTLLSFCFLLIVVGICALTIAAIADHMGG